MLDAQILCGQLEAGRFYGNYPLILIKINNIAAAHPLILGPRSVRDLAARLAAILYNQNSPATAEYDQRRDNLKNFWRNQNGAIAEVSFFLICCGLMLAMGLVWVTLDYLNARDKEYVERFVGTLKFLDATIKTSRDFDAHLYAPSIKPRPEPGHWVLSGFMVTRDSVAGRPRIRTDHVPYSAILESICLDYIDQACWRLEKLSVDGRVVNISEPVSSDVASTLEGGPRGSVVELSAPEEQSTPTAAETAATQSITASPPLENVTVPVQERLPCVEPPAWRDPDIDRNKQLIDDEAICLSVIEFLENGLKWRVQVLESGRPGNNWVVLHDDENTAFDSALYAIVRYGGKVVDVDLQPSTRSDAFVDPNHNFAITDDQRKTCGGPIRHAAPIFTSTIIEQLDAPPYLALHNNYDGHFRSGGSGNISVRHSTQGLFGLPAYDAVERLADEDNFIIVSGLTPPGDLTDRMHQLTDELRNSGINVIYEYIQEDSYDCSLSNYLLLYGGTEPGQYFNIEAEAGDYLSQITMIDALVGTLVNPLRASQ
jgi:hypothetical protein